MRRLGIAIVAAVVLSGCATVGRIQRNAMCAARADDPSRAALQKLSEGEGFTARTLSMGLGLQDFFRRKKQAVENLSLPIGSNGVSVGQLYWASKTARLFLAVAETASPLGYLHLASFVHSQAVEYIAPLREAENATTDYFFGAACTEGDYPGSRLAQRAAGNDEPGDGMEVAMVVTPIRHPDPPFPKVSPAAQARSLIEGDLDKDLLPPTTLCLNQGLPGCGGQTLILLPRGASWFAPLSDATRPPNSP